MKRKNFLTKGILGTAGIIAAPHLLNSCKNKDEDPKPTSSPDPDSNQNIVSDNNNSEELVECTVTPTESLGPFVNKSPSDLVRENIIGDRQGIPLKVIVNVKSTSDNCKSLAGVYVDLWHCDAMGNYSEYNDQLDGDFTNKHFLRGRQTTDENGIVSFLTIYPGWYPQRAPHLHLEVLDASGVSLLGTQTAFPEDISSKVYKTEHYRDNFDTTNMEDFAFSDSLDQNLPDKIEGNLTDGYVLTLTLNVSN